MCLHDNSNGGIAEDIETFTESCIEFHRESLRNAKRMEIQAGRNFNARALTAAIDALKHETEDTLRFGRMNREMIFDDNWEEHAKKYIGRHLENNYHEEPTEMVFAYFGNEVFNCSTEEMAKGWKPTEDSSITGTSETQLPSKAYWAWLVAAQLFKGECADYLKNCEVVIEDLRTRYRDARVAYEEDDRSTNEKNEAAFMALVESAKDAAYKHLQRRAGVTAPDDHEIISGAFAPSQREQMIAFGKSISGLGNTAENEQSFIGDARERISTFLLEHLNREEVKRGILEPVLYLIQEAVGHVSREDGVDMDTSTWAYTDDTREKFAEYLTQQVVSAKSDGMLVMYRRARVAYTEDLARIAQEAERLRREQEIQTDAKRFNASVLQAAIANARTNPTSQERICRKIRDLGYDNVKAVKDVLKKRIVNDFWLKKVSGGVDAEYFGQDPDVFTSLFPVEEIGALEISDIQLWVNGLLNDNSVTDEAIGTGITISPGNQSWRIVADELCDISFRNCDASQRVLDTTESRNLRARTRRDARANASTAALLRGLRSQRASADALRQNRRDSNRTRGFLRGTHAGAGTRSASRPTAMRSTNASAIALDEFSLADSMGSHTGGEVRAINAHVVQNAQDGQAVLAAAPVTSTERVAWNFPTAQSSQLSCPAVAWNFPAAQSEQLPCPAAAWNFPTAQSAATHAE